MCSAEHYITWALNIAALFACVKSWLCVRQVDRNVTSVNHYLEWWHRNIIVNNGGKV